MRVFTRLPMQDWHATAQAARDAEAAGYDAVMTVELGHDVFAPLAVAALATERVELTPSVAVAFPRSPTVLASQAWDLQANSRGRFVLGLGSQVKGHNERRFGIAWNAPAPRLRDYVQALRAVWQCWETGGKLDFQSEHYTLTLMTPDFSPEPTGLPMVPVTLAAVGEAMLRVAGQVADGVRLHPLCSRRYLEEVCLPQIEVGMARGGRARENFDVHGGGFVVTGPNEATVTAGMEAARGRIGFYGSTRTYMPILALHGLQDLSLKLHRMSVEGRWNEMSAQVSDDVVRIFAACGTYANIAKSVELRYGGAADSIDLDFPPDAPVGLRREVLSDIHRIPSTFTGFAGSPPAAARATTVTGLPGPRNTAEMPAAHVARMTHAHERLIADIRQLAPQLAERAAGFDQQRRVPPDIVATLRTIGVYRIFAPRLYDGMELDFPAGLEVIIALARIDGSLGWNAMITSAGALFTALAARETLERVYRNGPDVIVAGSVQPVGTAEAAGSDWRVNGRWPFASGCEHADWLIGVCVMLRDGKKLTGPQGPDGPPLMQACVLPARDWRIEDTWHVAGLKGTGSHHIGLQDAVVADANFLDLFNGRSVLPGPLYAGALAALPLLHAAVSVGLVEGALDELIATANTGRTQSRAASPMRESEVFQYELGRAAADIRGARAALDVEVANYWRHACAGTLNAPARATETSHTGVWITATCVRAVDALFALGGGSAVYDASPLQRRMRDMHTAAQHAQVQQRNYVNAGRLLLNSPHAPA